MARIVSLLHASLMVANLARARSFYEGVLGLTPSLKRPDLGFPGVWYEIGAGQIHLINLSNSDPVEGRPEHGGRDRHIALGVVGLEEIAVILENAGLPFTRSRSGRAALFVRDPDGNALELMELEATP